MKSFKIFTLCKYDKIGSEVGGRNLPLYNLAWGAEIQRAGPVYSVKVTCILLSIGGTHEVSDTAGVQL